MSKPDSADMYILKKKNNPNCRKPPTFYIICKKGGLEKFLNRKRRVFSPQLRNKNPLTEIAGSTLPCLMKKIMEGNVTSQDCSELHSNKVYSMISNLVQKENSKPKKVNRKERLNSTSETFSSRIVNKKAIHQTFQNVFKRSQEKVRIERMMRYGGLRFRAPKALEVSKRCMSPPPTQLWKQIIDFEQSSFNWKQLPKMRAI